MPSLSEATHWLLQHFIEIIAVLSGLMYVIYTIRENILLWLFGIISSALYIWVFYHSGIYAYSLLYVYYVIIGFYGWYNWSRKPAGSQQKENPVRIRHTSRLYLSGCIIFTIVLSIPLYFLLKRYTDSDMAATDALLTSGGMIATWMLTQKYIEQWLFWILIDSVSFGAMIYKGLYPSAFLFLVYALLAVKGYLEWNKELKTG
jgi:nicotinamide mononucleotide transporter